MFWLIRAIYRLFATQLRPAAWDHLTVFNLLTVICNPLDRILRSILFTLVHLFDVHRSTTFLIVARAHRGEPKPDALPSPESIDLVLAADCVYFEVSLCIYPHLSSRRPF